MASGMLIFILSFAVLHETAFDGTSLLSCESSASS